MIRLAVRIRGGQEAELVLAELLELAPSGVEEVSLPNGDVEYGVYGAPGELPSLPALRAAAGAALVGVATSEIADDWAERWREFHRPLVLGRELCVRPPWEPPADTRLDVVIDPGRAFGTGAHATTRLCLELLLELARGRASGGSLVDVGCGSGVLAIAAAKLGFGPVMAIDNDPAALEATAANAAANAVSLDVRRLDMRAGGVPPADLWVANVLAPPLRAWAAAQSEVADTVILSGLLEPEANQVAQAFQARGLAEAHRRASGEWVAPVLTRVGVQFPSLGGGKWTRSQGGGAR